MQLLFALSFLFFLPSVPLLGQSLATATQTITAQINAVGKLLAPTTLTLTHTGNLFSAYSGSILLKNEVRTSAGGSATVTLTAGQDFSPSGGPTLAGGNLNYVCGGATYGTACSGTQTVRTTSQTPIIVFGGSTCTGGGAPCSSVDPNTVNITFGLDNDPAFRTGTYSTSLLFVISAI